MLRPRMGVLFLCWEGGGEGGPCDKAAGVCRVTQAHCGCTQA